MTGGTKPCLRDAPYMAWSEDTLHRSVQGVALSFVWNATYGEAHLHNPCPCVPERTLKMAHVVPDGLLSVGHMVGKGGCGEGTEDIYVKRAWGVACGQGFECPHQAQNHWVRADDGVAPH